MGSALHCASGAAVKGSAFPERKVADFDPLMIFQIHKQVVALEFDFVLR